MNNELKNLYILSILPFLLFETIFAQAPVNRFDFANFFNKTKIESSNKSGTLNYFEYLLNSYGLHKPPLSDAVVNLSKSFSTPPYEQLGTTLPTFKSPVESFYENKNAIKGVQSFLKVGSDGIVGPTTEKAIKNFQSTNGLNPTGKVDDKTLQKIQEQMNAGSKSGENTSLGGSGKGDTIGLMQGTNFCTRTNGGPDGSGVSSCGTYTGDCKNLGKNVKAETKKLCSYCPDCQFIKGSCGTPMYFYKGSKQNAQTEANKKIEAVALTESKLEEVFGSSDQSAYCDKNLIVCNGLNNCKSFPIRDTGHAGKNKIDMTGAVYNALNIPGNINPTGLIVKRVGDPSNTQVAELKR